MLRRTLLLSAIAIPALSACASTVGAADPMAPLPHDTSSHARPDEARVRHVSLDLTADFDRKVFHGKATLDIVARNDAREIVLDSDGLVIRAVRAGTREAAYTIGEVSAGKGAPLTIQLNGPRQIEIEYESAPNASALQWLEPAQTASNKRFLFSQGQSIHNRTWIPTQDSPGIRQTYDARIVVPADLKAVMSAEMLTPDGEPAGEGQRAFRFRMPQPIPPYLIAIGIGDLAFRAVGPRTGVYAEPSVVERGAYECADMERMMDVAEALYGPYRWGRYDVLILPPSFPYGGMENPRLTFLTPTFLAGDRSLVSLVAHELAHSWSGNLVTNAVWADSWLNEGFTSYIEGRIGEALFGAEHARMAEALAWTDIQAALTTVTPDGQRLHWVGEVDANENSSAITYDKGATFLRTVERIVGRDRLDSYLRSYFDRYAFQPMTTQAFLADFRQHVVRGDAALEARLMLDQWAYEPGIPSNAVAPVASGFDEIPNYVAAFVAGGPAAAAPWEHWNTMQRQRYLQTMPRQLPAERLRELERAFALDTIGNMEVRFDWLMIAVRNGYQPSGPAVERFLSEQGRGKFVRPIYRALMDEGAWGQNLARTLYRNVRGRYHPIVQAGVDRIVTPA
ncbi:M1 family metallopeptidase [Terricaulis sp.]|uniref:M1 family metallopeptidase n=1 Tax=Terricaulis sp. TaxID=2768686 RepID=UPI002AC4DFA9|nr:M1 family metallopeptidase [Terricaulis sp.]MDZ4692648.1 M1 family metallopeptidase [Terricaulis sp.]